MFIYSVVNFWPLDEDHYLAFGLSGSDTRAQMKGSDITIAYIDGYRGFVDDYNITELSAVSIYNTYARARERA